MKNTIITLALAALAATSVYAQAPAAPAASNQEQHKGQMKQQKGKRTGPMDGSGPIHTPGTGGGTGRGQRGPRR